MPRTRTLTVLVGSVVTALLVTLAVIMVGPRVNFGDTVRTPPRHSVERR